MVWGCVGGPKIARLMSHESETTQKEQTITNKHHHHGGDAANPYSGVDLSNLHRPRVGSLAHTYVEAAVERY
jgi:hypothetical protein